MEKGYLAAVYDSLKTKNVNTALMNLKVLAEQNDLNGEAVSLKYIREDMAKTKEVKHAVRKKEVKKKSKKKKK